MFDYLIDESIKDNITYITVYKTVYHCISSFKQEINTGK